MVPDVAIVGGSFAGLACAGAAAARGLRVTVVDQRSEPGARVRTTGLLVKELVEAWDVPPALTRPVTGVRLYARAGRHVDLASPAYFFAATDTPALLRWLDARARALGARARWGTQVHGAHRAGDGWRLAGPDLHASMLVGADGPRSRVAAWCGLGRNRRFLCGAEAEVIGVRGLASDRLHCFLDRRLAPGYLGWVIPGVGGVTQVGLACRQGVRPDLGAMLARAASVFDFDRARVVTRRGGLIPVGGPVRPVAAPGVVLVGDAAGHVSPLTAGGIHRAWRHGRAAAHAIADHWQAGGPAPHVAVARAQPWSRWKGWLRVAADWGPPDWAMDALLATRPLRALAAVVFFHSRGLKSPRAWRDIVGCLFTGRVARH